MADKKEQLRKSAENAIEAADMAEAQGMEDMAMAQGAEDVAAEDTPAPVGREALLARVREHYPDRDMADDDDDALYGGLDEYARERDQEMEGYRENEQKLSDMMTRDPRSANLLLALRDGKSLAVEMMRRFGPELKDALDNPDLLESIAEAEKEYIERVQKGQELEEQYQTNLADSLQTIDDWQAERGISDEEQTEVYDYLKDLSSNLVLGIVNREMLDFAYNALHHDADVASAEYEGEVRGRNANIEQKKRNPAQTDGVPLLGGAGTRTEPERKRSIFDEAREAY